jgi:hypothetical protein
MTAIDRKNKSPAEDLRLFLAVSHLDGENRRRNEVIILSIGHSTDTTIYNLTEKTVSLNGRESTGGLLLVQMEISNSSQIKKPLHNLR